MVSPQHKVSPEDFLHFVQLDEFAEDWKSLGFDIEDDLWALEILIMTNPERGDVVPGTGGLRKIRFGKGDRGIGKRKGVRVCYAYFKEHWTVLLVVAYGKNEKDDLTESEKKYIRDYLKRAKAWLDKKKY
ncbi:MAG: addiction module toxin RelE [Planctomycetes bacterium]|nr:addiction module toxin RelE [Planctomycetota bacterium]